MGCHMCNKHDILWKTTANKNHETKIDNISEAKPQLIKQDIFHKHNYLI